MRTSNEKIRELGEQLPAIVTELAGDMRFSVMGIPMPVTEILGMVAPMLSAEIEKLADMETDELDEQLERVVGFVDNLRSDRESSDGGA